MSEPPPGRDRRAFRRRTVDQDVDREIRTHLEQRTEELVGRGWEDGAARHEALRLFGDSDAVAEECTRIARRTDRADRRARMVGSLWQDVRYGARTLARSPGFTAVAVATLGLGIGANSAVFSVVSGVLLRPLPYDEPEELVWVAEWQREGRPMAVAWLNFVDWHAESAGFEALAAYGSSTQTILGGQRPLIGGTASVSADFWRVFGVRPVRGRLTVASDHVPGAQPALVVGERFWRNELGGVDLDAASLEVSGVRAQVVGVVPPGFDFPEGTDVWGAAELFPQSNSRTSHNWRVVGRLAEGVGAALAEQEVDALTRRIVQSEVGAAPDYLAVGATVVPLHERLVGDSGPPLYLLLGAAGLVLLVACTNLASTLLARGSARTRELAVRVSLGAGKGRIARQLLTESLLLAGLGAVAGLALASGVVAAVTRMGPATVPRLDEVGVDGGVLLYTGAVAVLTALLFGLFPIVRLTRSDPSDELRSGTRVGAAERGIVWGALVATEVALALVLLVGSGLLVRSFRTLLAEDAGFDARDVTLAEVSLSRIKYEGPPDHALWYDGLIAELEALPAVTSAGVMSSVPMTGFHPNGRIEIDGDLDKHADAVFVLVGEGAFEALDVPLLRGRLFDERDRADGARVAIVSASFAERYWPGEDPVGRSVTGGGMDDLWEERPFHEVVGVVGDVRYQDLAREPTPVVYFPYGQRPFRLQYGAYVVVESATGEPAAVSPGLRSTLQRLDPDVPVRVSPLESTVSASVADRRFTVVLLGGFSLIALLLAGVGVYGVVSYSVARRTREMGIRMALGADAGRVLRLVVGSSARTIVAGLALGLAGAWVFSGAIRGLLYEVSPTDPTTLASVVAILAAVGLLATWLPARAGTRVDPMVTMRAE